LQDPTLIINFKNYAEVRGKKALELARKVDRLARELGLSENVIVAPPTPLLALVSLNVDSIRVIAQHVDDVDEGSTTGYITVEMLRSINIIGSLVNHSEHRLEYSSIVGIVKRLRSASMVSVVCASVVDEVRALSQLEPEYIAIEPPELIGTGNAVSRSRPDVIIRSRETLASNKYTRLLCGAGIVDATDIREALRLGSEGVLVASSIVRAKDWDTKLHEMMNALQSNE
jgi:triosephosphate isomerase